MNKLWRLGRKVPLNVYEGDRPVAQFHAEADAALVVKAVNGYREWQPIETAPKDRRPILLYCLDRNRTEIGLWLNDKDGWAFRNLTSREMGWVFTHWMELPKPPKES